MAGRARNAAGTRSFSDLFHEPGETVRWMIGRPSRGPDDDLDDLRLGRPLLVSALSRRDRRIVRFQAGCLILQLDAPRPIIWRRYRVFNGYGSGVPLDPPFEVEEAGRDAWPGTFNPGDPRFCMIVVYAAGRRWDLAVPKVDLQLVRAALAAANRPDIPPE